LGANDEKVTNALIQSSSDTIAGVRMEVAEALGLAQVKQEEVVSTQLRFLTDDDGWVRMKAATALGRFIGSDKRVRNALAEQKNKDLDLGVKWAAEQSLSAMEQ